MMYSTVLRSAVKSVACKAKNATWMALSVMNHGLPRTMLHFGDAPGDDLLCTSVLHELRKRGGSGLWMLTRHQAIFAASPDVDRALQPDGRFARLADLCGCPLITPYYAAHDFVTDHDVIPVRHIISLLCQKAAIKGEIELRPYLWLSNLEREHGRIANRQIVVQSSGRGAKFHMQNKEWYPERFQEVVNQLRGGYEIIQLGTLNDPPLHGVRDLRGKTDLRQAAAIISQSQVFLGLVGFLMHIARAVECRAVIVFGGRELPWQSGYLCNENLSERPPCSPCWRWNACDHNRICMDAITVDRVTAAVSRQLARYGEPLEVERDFI